MVIIFNEELWLLLENAIGEENGPLPFEVDFGILSAVEVVKLDPGGIFHYDLGIEDLTVGEYIAAVCTEDHDSDALIFVCVVKGASYDGSVRIVGGLSFGVIDQKAPDVGVEGTTHKYIVAAVVDASIQIGIAVHIGKLMKFAEMADIDRHAAEIDITVGSGNTAYG